MLVEPEIRLRPNTGYLAHLLSSYLERRTWRRVLGPVWLAATTGALAVYIANSGARVPAAEAAQPLPILLVGAAIGGLVASFQRHLPRAQGLVPLGGTGALVAFGLTAIAPQFLATWLALGIGWGLITVPLLAVYQDTRRADARGNVMVLLDIFLCGCAFGMMVSILDRCSKTSQTVVPFWSTVGLLSIGVAFAWPIYLRSVLEQFIEIAAWPLYRIRARGPGLQEMPRYAPAIVFANHAAWLDPIWLGKVLPRFVTPMMTSEYYDKPVLRWLMTHVVHAIRVPAARFRREAPELAEAVAVLDRGGCVLIFPEGHVKRRAEQVLRRFGQGVSRILRERPQTPVVACWIEGGWGSFTSYAGGLPMRNKKIDFWRPIDIGVAPPVVLDPDLLKDQKETRDYLMHACVDARRYIGLEPLALEPPTNGEENGDEPAAVTEPPLGPRP
jgi:1-acyl-sn-glycerol-3-phosphate acyltransferase